MKHSLILVLLAAALTARCEAETKPERRTGRDCATAYFEALIQADTARANALVAVPFSYDRRGIFKSKEELEKKHQAIAASKGKRKVPEYTVSIPKSAPELDRAVFPEYEVFRITIAGDDEHIDIYVTKGAAPKVIGFSD